VLTTLGGMMGGRIDWDRSDVVARKIVLTDTLLFIRLLRTHQRDSDSIIQKVVEWFSKSMAEVSALAAAAALSAPVSAPVFNLARGNAPLQDPVRIARQNFTIHTDLLIAGVEGIAGVLRAGPTTGAEKLLCVLARMADSPDFKDALRRRCLEVLGEHLARLKQPPAAAVVESDSQFDDVLDTILAAVPLDGTENQAGTTAVPSQSVLGRSLKEMGDVLMPALQRIIHMRTARVAVATVQTSFALFVLAVDALADLIFLMVRDGGGVLSDLVPGGMLQRWDEELARDARQVPLRLAARFVSCPRAAGVAWPPSLELSNYWLLSCLEPSVPDTIIATLRPLAMQGLGLAPDLIPFHPNPAADNGLIARGQLLDALAVALERAGTVAMARTLFMHVDLVLRRVRKNLAAGEVWLWLLFFCITDSVVGALHFVCLPSCVRPCGSLSGSYLPIGAHPSLPLPRRHCLTLISSVRV
jgi:hypothetical protein